MSEDKPDYLKRKPVQVAEDTHTKIGEVVRLVESEGGVSVSYGEVVNAAIRALHWYFRACRAKGLSVRQIWDDASGSDSIITRKG